VRVRKSRLEDPGGIESVGGGFLVKTRYKGIPMVSQPPALEIRPLGSGGGPIQHREQIGIVDWAL